MTNETSHAERRWRAEGDQMARDARRNAEACNDILTARQARAVRDVLTVFPQYTATIVELVFDECGWPEDNLDECFLNESGLIVWNIYQGWLEL